MSEAATPAVLDAKTLGEAWAHVHEVVRRAGSSFFWAMRILPKFRRQAVFAVYAFCREVDDIADDDHGDVDKLALLAAWRREVEALYLGQPTTPTGRALAEGVATFELPRVEFLRLIDAVERDATADIHAPEMAALKDYCRGVAGAVGMLLIRIFGAHGPASEAFAVALGEALQLTNILRDIAEDAERGRLYLPAELLRQHGIDPSLAVPEILAHAKLPKVCAALAETARERYNQAEYLLAECDRRALRSALIMKAVYGALLDKLVQRGWHDLEARVGVGKFYKLWIALRYSLF